jgi:hypothetical protein
LQLQRFFGTEVGAFAARNAFIVINDGRGKAALRQRSDRAHLYGGTAVALGAVFCFDNKHSTHKNLLIYGFIK